MADPSHTDSATVILRAVCQGCGCLCDDIVVAISENAIHELRNVCAVGRTWYEVQYQERSATRHHVADPAAIEHAAAILSSAKLPVVLGIERLTTEAQRAAIKLAKHIGAVVASEECSAIVARQEVGEVTCSLGEIKARADLVVFWFADALRTHPRHLERYSAHPASEFLPNGRTDRFLIAVDKSPTATSESCDQFLPLAADDEFAAVQELRLRIRQRDLGSPASEKTPTPSPLAALLDRMKTARYGVLVINSSRYSSSSASMESLFKLVRDLNAFTAFAVAPLGGPGNAKGAENVLQWLTGFPANVDFAGGVPHYDGAVWSPNELLERGRPDAALVFGANTKAWLGTVHTIQIGGSPSGATVYFPAATPIETSGTVFRMDGVPLPTDAVLKSRDLDPLDILQQLTAALSP